MADISTLEQHSQGAVGGPHPGWYLLRLKDALVAEGWTVRGSGDGLSRFGHTDAATTVPLAQQGSGGDYDCWSVGGVTDGVAGSASNGHAWVHMRSPSGIRDCILTADPSGFPQHMYGRIGITREGLFMDGTSANATTIPTVATATDIAWLIGSVSSGGYLYSNTTTFPDFIRVGWIILEGGEEWITWSYYYDDSAGQADANSNEGWAGVISVENPHPDDTDPWYYCKRSGFSNPFQFWNYLDNAWFTTTSASSAVSLQDSRQDPDTELVYPYGYYDTSAPTLAKGNINRDMVIACEWLQDFGDRQTEVGSGRVYVHIRPFDTMRVMMRWPDTSTTLQDATHNDLDVWDPFYVDTTTAPSAPSVAVVNPLAGSPIGKTQAITLEITDADGLVFEQISLYDPDTDTEEVIQKNGATRGGFKVTRTAIADGFRYVITRNEGWTKAPTFLVDGVDLTGGAL